MKPGTIPERKSVVNSAAIVIKIVSETNVLVKHFAPFILELR
jgi:hypothetical protein